MIFKMKNANPSFVQTPSDAAELFRAALPKEQKESVAR